MHDFLRIACAVPGLKVGDACYNAESILIKCSEAEKSNADIVVFPELSMTGYTCADLFFQKTLLDSAIKYLKYLCRETEKNTAVYVIGAPIEAYGQIYNCAVVIYKGKICGIVPKTFLPNYSEYYEKRWFASSEHADFNDITASSLGIKENYTIPFGRDIIFDLGGEVRFGAELCEDLWAVIPPSDYLALGGAEVIVNLSAGDEVISKRDYRKNLVCQQSAGTISVYAYCSAGTGESSTDLVFSGHSLVAENGILINENKNLTDSDYLLISDVDIGKIKADRMKNTSFRDCSLVYGRKRAYRYIFIDKEIYSDGEYYEVVKLPFVPYEKSDRLKRCMDIFEMQSAGLLKRMSVIGYKPVVGVSGGLDSTLALLVCAYAMKKAGKDASMITGITMPCFGTTDRTHDNAVALMKTLGIALDEINIKEACISHFKDIGQDPDNHDVTYENCQARERTQVLMDYAGKIGGFVVGTGDLSELALGWCTYNADHMSMYGVNCGVPKTLVRWMIDSVLEYNIFPGSTDILKDILDTPISPELLPPDEKGEIVQQTEDIVGPYALHDFFLYNVVRFGFSPSKIFFLAQRAFRNDFKKEEILRWLKVFYKRFFSQQFKRSCLPDGIKIGSICLSPRGDLRMPSDASSSLWLNEIENLEIN